MTFVFVATSLRIQAFFCFPRAHFIIRQLPSSLMARHGHGRRSPSPPPPLITLLRSLLQRLTCGRCSLSTGSRGLFSLRIHVVANLAGNDNNNAQTLLSPPSAEFSELASSGTTFESSGRAFSGEVELTEESLDQPSRHDAPPPPTVGPVGDANMALSAREEEEDYDTSSSVSGLVRATQGQRQQTRFVPAALSDITQSPSGTTVTAGVTLAAGGNQSMAVRHARPNEVDAWGETPPEDITGQNYVAVATGLGHSITIQSDGSIACWGLNNHGQAPRTPIHGNDFVAVAVGSWHSLALRSDGTVVCWGFNNQGQAPPNGIPGKFVAIAAGAYHSLGIREDGSVACWGLNNHKQAPRRGIAGDYVAIAAGYSHSMAMRRDGTVRCWGDNSYGQAPPEGVPRKFVAIAAGWHHSIAIAQDGGAVCWGANDNGQAPPEGVAGAFVSVAAGECHSLALRDDGSVACWGSNQFGQAPPAGVPGPFALPSSRF